MILAQLVRSDLCQIRFKGVCNPEQMKETITMFCKNGTYSFGFEDEYKIKKRCCKRHCFGVLFDEYCKSPKCGVVVDYTETK